MALDWANERYVRLYTRDTPNWTVAPWEARAVLPLILKKLDRKGLLDLGSHGMHALAATVSVPLEVLEPGLAWWTSTGTLVLSEDGILSMPHFVEAQECCASPARRQKNWRERQDVSTERRNVSAARRNVTKRNTRGIEGNASETPMSTLALSENGNLPMPHSAEEQECGTSAAGRQTDWRERQNVSTARRNVSPARRNVAKRYAGETDIEEHETPSLAVPSTTTGSAGACSGSAI